MFNDISVGIKTILRDDKLKHTVESLERFYPGIQIIIADDGHIGRGSAKFDWYWELSQRGHKVLMMPFDSGFGAKSNIIARVLTRPYLLIGSDDFDFSEPDTVTGIRTMHRILEAKPELDIVSGRVNNNPYEFYLVESPDRTIVEEVRIDNPQCLTVCDLTVNYSMVRKIVFDRVGWDEDVKIGGGEHGAFFLDVKRAGFKTAWVPGVNINTQPGTDSEEYRALRNRARSKERPCFVKRGIKLYTLGDRSVDYEARDSR
jgi:hypothetical protein